MSSEDIRFPKRISFPNLFDAITTLSTKHDAESTIFLDIARKIYNGDVFTLSNVRQLLGLPTSMTENEVIDKVVNSLPLYAYKESWMSDFILTPMDVAEQIYFISLLYENTNMTTTAIRRGPYNCSICQKSGHTKAKCPERIRQNIPTTSIGGRRKRVKKENTTPPTHSAESRTSPLASPRSNTSNL
ncbi:hypothetical protein P9112_002366 [Eukaryota sp. TZLM1-RC]